MHVYEWAKRRGYWTRDRETATHLLLDGGKLAIPDDANGEFLNAYATSVVRYPNAKPCVVELRTPRFRMFADLDVCPPGDFDAEKFLTIVLDAFDVPGRAIVSTPNVPGAGGKRGFHVTWPDAVVTAGIAAHLRRRALERLAGVPGYAWETVLDASVYSSNGLRLPWSAKGRGDQRYYEACFVKEPGGAGPGGELRPLRATTVSQLREAVRDASIRAFSTSALYVPEDAPEGAAEPADAGCGVKTHSLSLAAYAHVLDDITAALPPQFRGQKFTGLVATEHCFMLRSTARHCFNVAREHTSSNVYFQLTTKGVCQKCYCRKETTEGRKYGLCKDFASQYWEVPQRVLDAFFPAPTEEECGSSATPPPPGAAAEAAAKPRPQASTMPSRSAKSFLSLDAIIARSRPAMGRAAPAKKKLKAAPREGSGIPRGASHTPPSAEDTSSSSLPSSSRPSSRTTTTTTTSTRE